MAKGKKLTGQQRNKVADKLMTWANMVFAGMVIAQVFARPFNGLVAVAGAALFFGAYVLAIRIMKGGETG